MDSELRDTLVQVLERYSLEQYDTVQWRAYGAEPHGFSTRVWADMADLGWFMLGVPEELGGSGESILDLLPLFVAAGGGLWREPLLPILGGTFGALLALPPGQAREELIESALTGAERVGFAHAEPHQGWTQDVPVTVAKATDGAYALTGAKRFVLAAPACRKLVVSARVEDGEAIGFYLVVTDDPTVTLSGYRTIDDRGAADLQLDATPAIPLGGGPVALRAPRNRMMILAAAEALGAMAAVNRITREFLSERHQFDRSLSTFQVLQYRLVDMHMVEQESAALLARTAAAFDRDAPDLDRRLLILRAQVARAARFVTQQGIQLHGGIGMTDELMIGHYYKRALLLDSLCGSAQWALDRMAAGQA